MAKKIIDLREKLRKHKFEFGILQEIDCTENENKGYEELLKSGGALPENVFPRVYDDGEVSTTEFYTIYETDLTEDERKEYFAYKQLSMIRIIKNCVVFFAVLTIIGIIVAVISYLSLI